MVIFQALNWESRDIDDKHLISIFGRTKEGKSVCLTTEFKPYFFIKITKFTNIQDIYKKLESFVESFGEVQSKDLWGFQNNEKKRFLKLNFTTLENMKACDRKLRYPLSGEKFPCKVHESNLDPILRFMHRTNIQSTGWLDSGSNCIENDIAKTDIDLFCNKWNTLTPVECDDLAPFVVASFDIEANSSTGKFPDPSVHGDCVFQIGISLCRQGETEVFDKTCLCYKKTSNVEDCKIVSSASGSSRF